MGRPRMGAAARGLGATGIAAAAWIAFGTSSVLARGGGGGHGGSSGGGGHSGGGGYGGGGGGGAGGGIVGFIVLIIVVIVAIILWALLKGWLRRRFGGTAASLAGAGTVAARLAEIPRGPDPSVLQALTAIRAADPGFDPETFLQRSEMAFLLVKRAYQDRDAGAARPYLAAPLFATWSPPIEELTRAGLRPLLENLNVRGMEVVRASHDDQWDQLAVHIDYVAASRIIEDATGKLRSGTTEDTRYGEDWTFARRAGAVTPAGGGTTAKRCPNCGAAQDDMRASHCEYCHADFSSGQQDWIVTGIRDTRFEGAPAYPSGFGGQTLDAQAGVAALREGDPAFDQTAFLERARQAFTSLQSAWQARDLEASRAFMSPGLYLGWSSQVRQLIDLRKVNRLDHLQVDDCSIVRVVHGTALDNVSVRVRARCADYEVDEGSGRVIFGSKSVKPFTEYWTFQRGRGVATTGRSVMDSVCPNCGAPLQINALGDCAFCRAGVTSGRFDWVLSRIEQEEEWSGA